MRLLPLGLVLLVPLGDARAQFEAAPLGSQRRPAAVVAGLYHQQYEADDDRISETSVPVGVAVPVGRRGTFGLSTSLATVGGDVEGVSGLGDVQLSGSYGWRPGTASVVVGLGLNLPTGKRRLSPDEFDTSVLMSLAHLDLRVPAFAQGFNVAPSVTVARTFGDGLVLGAGASYQRKGAYRPRRDADAYDPGEEIIVTGGGDFRVTPRASVAADVTFTTYSADQWGDDYEYTAGNRLIATGQARWRAGADEAGVVARYRSRAKADFPEGFEEVRTVPSYVELAGRYRRRFSPSFGGEVGLRARLFEGADEALPNGWEIGRVFDLSVRPELALGRRGTAAFVGAYTLGDLSGYALGVLTTVTF